MVESKHLAILFVAVAAIAALAAFVSKQPGGWIETAGGSVCSWRTEGDAISNRALKLDCTCPGKRKLEVAYSCKYVGKPQETCASGFKKKVFEFFYEMIDTIKAQTHGCSLEEMTREHITVCREFDAFSMKRDGDMTPDDCQ